jgi:hypothetical protein
VQTDEGASVFLHNTYSGKWVPQIFGGRYDRVVEAIRTYSPRENEDYYLEMEAIATDILKTTKKQLPENATPKDVKDYFHVEKVDFLGYLLPELQMGVLLGDDNKDDQTQKMDGGLSGLVKSIGAAFDHAEPIKNFTHKTDTPG